MTEVAPKVVSSEQGPQELYMLSKRDNVEKERLKFEKSRLHPHGLFHRLDAQSNIIKIVREGCVLDPAIPKSDIRKIADIATGTGIWLGEASLELAAAGIDCPLETMGFDISANQLPTHPAPGNKFVVWDATTSFPPKYHNYFDVVHARLLTVAVTVEQIKMITKHAVEILKPGGYLQWTDWTYTNGLGIIYPSGEGELSLSSEGEEMFRFHGEQGFSYDTTGDVAKALESLPVQDVNVTDHTGASHNKPEIRELVADWHSRVIPLFMNAMSRRQGRSEEEAKARADNYRRKVIEMGKNGVIFEIPITTLFARKQE